MQTPFGTREVFHTWLRFDLSSINPSLNISEANLMINVQSGGGSNEVYEGYTTDWTQPISVGQWVDPRDFSAATPIISQNDLSISAGSDQRLAFTAAGITALENAINGSGIIEFIIVTQRAVDDNWTTGNFSIGADFFEDGAANAPRIELVTNNAGGFLFGANF